MINIKPPYLGAAYYPEDWDEAEIDKDISGMLEMGINVARIGEFAWKKMEPQDGIFDFSWLHNVVDKLKKAGIAVVMGTPTATPPYWLTGKHPDMFVIKDSGMILQHGIRRHACSNNPLYRQYCARIVERLAQEFCNDEAIIGWQIDNEIYLQRCFCPHCEKKYRDYLKDKYGTIEEVNRRWNLNIFSQAYDSFEEIPMPKGVHGGNRNNPHQMMDFAMSSAESQIDFIHMQAEILHKYVKVPIGTDQMPLNGINYRHMHEPLDVIQFNHYNLPENLWECCLWMDYLRPMKDRPFWNTETSSNWTGASGAAGSIKPDGFAYANSWLPIALGGEANMYWPWRTHWACHELTHGALVDSSGRPMYSAAEVKRVGHDFKLTADFINETKVETDVAMHYTSLNWNMFETQAVVNDFVYEDNLKKYFYKPIIDSGLRPDVIDAESDLNKYKVIFSPLMLSMDEYGLRERISEWVKNGGIWVSGPMTDVRTCDGTKFTDRVHGMLESLTDAKCLYRIPDIEKRVQSDWNDGENFNGNFYYEIFESIDNADIVNVKAGHKALEGKAVLQRFDVGKGKVYILGTLPDYKDMRKLITTVCEDAGVACNTTTGDSIIVSHRKGYGKQGLILVEVGGKGGSYTLKKKARNLISGESIEGKVDLQPYEVMVLEYC